MTDCLVTGGAGFIGSHLVTRFVEEGWRVRVLDNFTTGKRENLSHVGNDVEIVEGSLQDPSACEKACHGVEFVFHHGALPSVPKSIEEPVLAHESNVDGTFHLLLAARDAGCRRVVFAASSSAYGNQEESPKRESQLPSPVSPYAVHKLVGEYYLKVFSECFGLETISLRYFNVFGPRQDPKSQYAAAIPAFVTAILQDRPPTVFGDGEQTRDFTPVANVVHANLLAARAERVSGEVLNIACGESVSVNRVIGVINSLLGKNVEPRYEPVRPGDVMHSSADISLAKAVISFEPVAGFEQGLAGTIDWYREHAASWS